MRVSVEVLNIRSAPSTSAAIVDTATAGQILALDSGVEVFDGYWWRKINGRPEWVAWFHISSGTYFMEEYSQ